jgi:hypothetical protein
LVTAAATESAGPDETCHCPKDPAAKIPTAISAISEYFIPVTDIPSTSMDTLGDAEPSALASVEATRCAGTDAVTDSENARVSIAAERVTPSAAVACVVRHGTPRARCK